MIENRCRNCGAESQKFKICDNCYVKWEKDKIICQICEQKKTSSKIGVCTNCKVPFVEEMTNFLKSKTDYWNLIKERVKKNIISTEKEIKCLSQGCKTKFLISSDINKIIICPICGNKMQ